MTATLTRNAEDIDKDLRRLGQILKDQLRDSDQWLVTWERIDQLLEERSRLILLEEQIEEE